MFAGHLGPAMQDGQRHHLIWPKSIQGPGHDSLASKSLARLSSDTPAPIVSFKCEWIPVYTIFKLNLVFPVLSLPGKLSLVVSPPPNPHSMSYTHA